MRHLHKTLRSDKGATAILIALAVSLLLMGLTALVVDVGAGFNERRQDQTAADVAVMAGAVEALFGMPNDNVADKVQEFARTNLDTTYSDAEWMALWQGCTDSGRTAAFFPLPDPWGPGTLDCISLSSSHLRVRIPDQAVSTSFGRWLNVDELNTHAEAEALLGPASTTAPLIPYGISGAADPGEQCFGTSPSGIAYPPCSGPSSGTFGTLLSEFFGDFYGTVDCGNPGAPEIATATALGVDHFINKWPNLNGVTLGSAHPGDNYVLNTLTDTRRDACNNNGGVAVSVDGNPLNTVRVDSGFPSNEMESGLVSNDTFFGEASRLQQPGIHPAGFGSAPNSTRAVVKRRAGANEEIWNLDNHGPWDYLLGSAGSVDATCNPATYTPLLLPEDKAARFGACISSYLSTSNPPVIFDTSIDESPRFAWAPQYWYDLPTTGLSWEPVHEYRMVFIAGTFFNCNAGGCDVIFYPDADEAGELCDTGGGGCQLLSLDQFSAWYLPDEAIPEEVRNSFPGGQSPFDTSLSR